MRAILADQVEHVAFVEDDRDGATVADGEGPPTLLATAIAAWKVIGGWDESVPISVSMNGERIDVRLSYDGQRWTAEVERVRG